MCKRLAPNAQNLFAGLPAQAFFGLTMDSINPSYNINLDTTEDGIHLVGSVLWFDSKDASGLSFLLSANSIHKGKLNSRVIATQETLDLLALSRRQPKAMVCPYNRMVSIGQLRFELLPSGTMLGGSLIRVEAEDRSLLYAPHMQPDRTQVAHQIQVKPADIMVIGASVPFPSNDFPTRKREKERLYDYLKEAVSNQLSPVCFVDKFAVAPEVIRDLSDRNFDVVVHPSIAKVCKLYASHGSSVGSFGVYAGEKRSQTQGKVTLLPHPANMRLSMHASLPEGPKFYLCDFSQSLCKDQTLASDVQKRFTISSDCDPRELTSLIQKVSPETLCFFGPYAKEYASHFKHLAPKVSPLYPPHLPALF